MCLITALTVGLGAGITSALGMTAASTTTALVAGTIGTTMIGAGVAAVGAAAIGVTNSIQAANSARKAQEAQARALQKMAENPSMPEVNKTGELQENTRLKRTMSSLRVSMLPQKQTTEELINNVYGVDTNYVTTATQNMTGLNIAA